MGNMFDLDQNDKVWKPAAVPIGYLLCPFCGVARRAKQGCSTKRCIELKEATKHLRLYKSPIVNVYDDYAQRMGITKDE